MRPPLINLQAHLSQKQYGTRLPNWRRTYPHFASIFASYPLSWPVKESIPQALAAGLCLLASPLCRPGTDWGYGLPETLPPHQYLRQRGHSSLECRNCFRCKRYSAINADEIIQVTIRINKSRNHTHLPSVARFLRLRADDRLSTHFNTPTFRLK